MYTRVLSSMLNTWWYETNCIIDGYLGENYFDIGYCIGGMFKIVFDTTIG